MGCCAQIIRLILEVTLVETNVVSIIAANLVVIALGAIILAVGIKGVKAQNEPCHCCCCATWLDAYKVLTIIQVRRTPPLATSTPPRARLANARVLNQRSVVTKLSPYCRAGATWPQIVFCSFDLILSVAAVAFGGSAFALINVAYFTVLLSMLVTCLNGCNRLLSLLRVRFNPGSEGWPPLAGSGRGRGGEACLKRHSGRHECDRYTAWVSYAVHASCPTNALCSSVMLVAHQADCRLARGSCVTLWTQRAHAHTHPQ